MQVPPQAREWLAAIGRQGGRVGGKSTSEAKAIAARRNGKLGGRPRKVPPGKGISVAAVHEAAHAVIAVKLGISFSVAEIFPEGREYAHPLIGLGQIGGWVKYDGYRKKQVKTRRRTDMSARGWARQIAEVPYRLLLDELTVDLAGLAIEKFYRSPRRREGAKGDLAAARKKAKQGLDYVLGEYRKHHEAVPKFVPDRPDKLLAVAEKRAEKLIQNNFTRFAIRSVAEELEKEKSLPRREVSRIFHSICDPW